MECSWDVPKRVWAWSECVVWLFGSRKSNCFKIWQVSMMLIYSEHILELDSIYWIGIDGDISNDMTNAIVEIVLIPQKATTKHCELTVGVCVCHQNMCAPDIKIGFMIKNKCVTFKTNCTVCVWQRHFRKMKFHINAKDMKKWKLEILKCLWNTEIWKCNIHRLHFSCICLVSSVGVCVWVQETLGLFCLFIEHVWDTHTHIRPLESASTSKICSNWLQRDREHSPSWSQSILNFNNTHFSLFKAAAMRR